MDRSIPNWIVEHGVCIAEIRLKAIIIDQTGERGIYMDERLKKQLDFILEADKVKNIMRQTYLADGKRKENDAEHSWHLALMAVLLKEYAPEEVDLSKVIPMVQTTVAGITYLLVSDSQDDEANAYIMKDVSEEGSEEASYEMVEDDEELVAISKVFEQMLDDVDLEM